MGDKWWLDPTLNPSSDPRYQEIKPIPSMPKTNGATLIITQDGTDDEEEANA